MIKKHYLRYYLSNFLIVSLAASAGYTIESTENLEISPGTKTQDLNVKGDLPFPGRTVILSDYLNACIDNIFDEERHWVLESLETPEHVTSVQNFLLRARGHWYLDSYLFRCQDIEFSISDYSLLPQPPLVKCEILYSSIHKIQFPDTQKQWRLCFGVTSFVPEFLKKKLRSNLRASMQNNPITEQCAKLSPNVCEENHINYFLLSPLLNASPEQFIREHGHLHDLQRLEVAFLQDTELRRLQLLLNNLRNLTDFYGFQVCDVMPENIKTIVLNNKKFTKESLQGLKTAYGLENLKICGKLNHSAVETLLEIFPSLTRLNRIRLRIMHIKNHDLKMLVMQIGRTPALEHLSLKLHKGWTNALLRMLKTRPSLKSLSLCDNFLLEPLILDKGLRNLSQLESLKLKDNQLEDHKMTLLVKGLSHTPCLKTLDLSFNNIGKAGASVLSQTLYKLTGLTKLNLFSNDLNSKGLCVLSSSLTLCPELKTISFGANGIGDKGVRALARSLPALTKLQTLDLQDNQLGDRSVEQIVDALCPSIVTVFLSCNNVTPSGIKCMEDNLAKFPALKTALFHPAGNLYLADA